MSTFILLALFGLALGALHDRSQTQLSRLLTATGGSSNDYFGCSVGLDWTVGQVAIVGAEGWTTGTGSAYVFDATFESAAAAAAGNTAAGFWGQRAQLTASDGVAGDHFGAAVSIYGNYAIVGSPLANPGGAVQGGAAYFFYRNQGSSNQWGQFLKVSASSLTVAGGLFGASVDMSASYAIVGCPRCNIVENTAAGAAFIFSLAGSWQPFITLTANDARGQAQFGNAVSITDDFAVVGSFQDRSWTAPAFSYTIPGSVYVFSSASLWTSYRKLTAPTLLNGLMFGLSVSIRGDDLMIGTFANMGRYRFVRSGEDDWTQVGYWDSSTTDQATTSLAFAGLPIVSDGTHAIAGDRSYAFSSTNTGAAFLLPHALVAAGPAAQVVNPQARYTYFYL